MTRSKCTVGVEVAQILRVRGFMPLSWSGDLREFDFVLSVSDAEKLIPPKIMDMDLMPDSEWSPTNG